jgi:hypothetical protein
MLQWLTSAFLASALAAPAPCELHLFGLDIGSAPQPKGNLFVQPLPRSDDPLAFINIMSPQDRMMDVSDEDYRRILRLPANTPVVRNWEVVIDPRVRKSDAPLVSTPGRCHVELIGYTSIGMAAGRSRTGKDEVDVSFLLREFSPEDILLFKFDKSGYGAVDSVKKVGRDAALLSLRTASVKLIEDFGERLAKRRSKVR